MILVTTSTYWSNNGAQHQARPVSDWVYKGSLINAGQSVMIVHKVNRKNYLCYDEAGRGWNVPIRNQSALPSSTTFDKTAYLAILGEQEKNSRRALDETLASPLVMGSIVEFIGGTDARKWPGKYVVIASPSAKARIKVAKLGGDSGRYVTGPVSMVREVTL